MTLLLYLYDVRQDSCLVRVEGRQYPVDIYYTLRPQKHYVDAAMQTCLQV